MASRKVFNFESVILEGMTVEKEGYSAAALGNSSAKFVWASCRFCGKAHRIRKGFFNKAGSACHDACRLEEMSASSPFSDPKVRAKSRLTNLKKYGVEHASQNEDVAKKIAETKRTVEAKTKTAMTNLQRYGVANPAQSEEVKEKIKEAHREKYGVDYAMQNPAVKRKAEKTVRERYGVDNVMELESIREKIVQTNLSRYGTRSPMQNEAIKRKANETFDQSIIDDSNNNYALINTLRGEKFWGRLAEENATLKEVCKEFGLNYQSATYRLVQEEFRDRYYETYAFPRQQQQREIRKLISATGLTVSVNDRSVIPPLELDIFVPEKNIAIEYNGSYWHSEACLDPKIARNKHRQKTDLCRAKGIRLFHIFEHQWLERPTQIMNFLRATLGVNEEKVAARKTKLTNDPCHEFLEEHHLMGDDRRAFRFFNLVYEGNVVATMTAAPHHRQTVDGNPVMLSRMCFKDGISVQGGATKLFKAFREWATEAGYDRVISFSDNCWSDGRVYEVMGFDLKDETGPDYFYWDMVNRRYVSKQSQRKARTKCPEDKTEREWCAERGLFRIWDCGKKRWEYAI